MKFINLGHKAQVFLGFVKANHVAKLSPDTRKSVGSVLFSNTEFISSGFNGKPLRSRTFHDCVNPATGTSYEDLLHSEIRTIVKAGLELAKHSSMCVTSAPCCRCAGVIAEAKIAAVYFIEPHDENMGVTLLKEDYGMTVYDCSPFKDELDVFESHFDLKHLTTLDYANLLAYSVGILAKSDLYLLSRN